MKKPSVKKSPNSKATICSSWVNEAKSRVGNWKRPCGSSKRNCRRPRWMIEMESVFGQMKNNRGFRRFLLRGLHNTGLIPKIQN
nr:transposase [Paenibacillus humicola]